MAHVGRVSLMRKHHVFPMKVEKNVPKLELMCAIVHLPTPKLSLFRCHHTTLFPPDVSVAFNLYSQCQNYYYYFITKFINFIFELGPSFFLERGAERKREKRQSSVSAPATFSLLLCLIYRVITWCSPLGRSGWVQVGDEHM